MLIEEVFYKVEVEKLLRNVNATLKNSINLITLTRDYNIFYNEIKDVKREFSFNNFRLDTLAFDESSKAFVIIEYKNIRSLSVIAQGYAYL